MESPLNLAHQQARKADMMMKSGKFESAICCHRRASEHLLEAMLQTHCQHALESLRLQHQHHLRQQDILQEKQICVEKTLLWQNRSRNTVSQASQTQGAHQPSQNDVDADADLFLRADGEELYKTLTETDSLLNFLALRKQSLSLAYQRDTQPKPEFVKIPKDDKTVIEELRIHNDELRRCIRQLLEEVEDLRKENRVLPSQMDKKEQSGQIGEEFLTFDLPPLEMPTLNLDMWKSDCKDQDTSFEESVSTVEDHV
ncbi:nuclear receptor-binding factor 2-like [Gigantopelta aegis]|uniref:nuclear receptor-binding factor 2-like n=1 Tax=Gigantopelta aegis TaxID=1735272 RepID=UPI001B887A9F|nr:nuclear receptor-binding factor 2-like [Gigantopelta aegis]